MNKILTVLLLLLSLSCFAQTQTEMNMKANKTYQEADKELNKVYQKILKEYKSDVVFIDRLKKAQRIWITFRDAELEMKFPEEDKQAAYGSMYSLCASSYLKELTEERTQRLKEWLKGAEDGDVCSGSIQVK